MKINFKKLAEVETTYSNNPILLTTLQNMLNTVMAHNDSNLHHGVHNDSNLHPVNSAYVNSAYLFALNSLTELKIITKDKEVQQLNS